MKNDSSLKSFLLYIRYPYTALIIATIWISMAIIITKQNGKNLELLLALTAICTIFIAYKGFKTL